MRYAPGVLVLAAACAGAGCILPVSTGAPLPATTVGKGRIGYAVSSEVPTLDLIAEEDAAPEDDPFDNGAGFAASMTHTLSIGVGDATDVEVAAEGALYYFLLPLVTGGTVGFRHHLDVGDDVDAAVAIKVGGVTSGEEASATYAALQAVIQRKHGVLRPLAAVNIMPSRIRREVDGETTRFGGLASSATLGLMFTGRHVTGGPYVSVTNFYSDQFDNSGFFVAGGLMLAFRPDRNAPPPVSP